MCALIPKCHDYPSWPDASEGCEHRPCCCQAGHSNGSSVNCSARLEQQTLGREDDVGAGHDLRGQVVGFEQMTKPQDVALVGQASHAQIEPCELATQRRVMQRLFQWRGSQREPLLQEVNTQQGCTASGRRLVLPAGL